MADSVKWTSKELDAAWNRIIKSCEGIGVDSDTNLTRFRLRGIDVEEIVGIWLRNHGYDGLYADDICGCFLENLVLCDGVVFPSCRPGYRQPDPDNPGRWIIGPDRP